MSINKFLNTITYLNILIENITYDDVEDIQKSIIVTKTKMDDLDAIIQNKLTQQNNQDSLPFTKIKIDFIDNINLSVRSAVKKIEYNLSGRQKFNVLSVNNKYLILTKDEWDYRIGLFLYYDTLQRRSNQKGEIQLFFNEFGKIHTGEITRSGLKEKITFNIIEIK
jgi:hypothetical protein